MDLGEDKYSKTWRLLLRIWIEFPPCWQLQKIKYDPRYSACSYCLSQTSFEPKGSSTFMAHVTIMAPPLTMKDMDNSLPTTEARHGLRYAESSTSSSRYWQIRVGPKLKCVRHLWYFLPHCYLRLRKSINVPLKGSNRIFFLFAWSINLSNFKELIRIFIRIQWYISKRALETKNCTIKRALLLS